VAFIQPPKAAGHFPQQFPKVSEMEEIIQRGK
jgi:hypothetical protein